MSFDEIFDLTAGVYFNLYSIYTRYAGSSKNIGLDVSFLEKTDTPVVQRKIGLNVSVLQRPTANVEQALVQDLCRFP